MRAIVVNYRDITERKSLEEQFRQAQKMEAVGQLAAGVAHDFNNLLTVILGRSQLLLHRLRPADPLRRHVELIQATGDRAAAMTQQLLAFSRKQVLQPKVIDVSTVVAGMEDMLHRLIGEDIELTLVLESTVGRVRADPAQIEQVVLNLAINARDAMPHGGRLTLVTADVQLDEEFVRRHPGARPGSHVILQVTDSGQGMDPETMSRVFEPFFTTKGPGKGTGLGLSTVYGITKQHQGYITVASEPRRGSRFTIYLPRVEEVAESPGAPPVLSGSLRGSETLLLVEDEAALRTLAREILETHGYAVLESRYPSEALLITERHDGPIHLMVTDVVMPDMSGPELARRLALARPGLRVLYMSGYTDDVIVHHGVLHSGIAFLQKPFSPGALTRKVREVLDSP